MKVGAYQLVEPVQAVGSLACYRGIDTRNDTPVEVRLLSNIQAGSAEFNAVRKRLATAALIESAAVRTIKSLEFDAPSPHLALEWLTAPRLFDPTGEAISPSAALLLAQQLAAVLAQAHRLGFVHGAVAPNLIRQRTDDQWTLDCAVLANDGVGRDDRPEHLAPEARLGEPEAASDIFSLAAILYRLLAAVTGDASDESRCDAEAIEAKLCAFDGLTAVAPQLGRLLSDGLAAEAAERPDAHNFAARLAEVERGMVSPSAVTSSGSGNTEIFPAESAAEPSLSETAVLDSVQIKASSTMPAELGRFRIVEKLGQGGMGAVYRGEDILDGTLAAIKVLSPKIAHNAQTKTRFAKEARMLARIQSPYIANLLEFNDDAGTSYLVTEFVPGRNLADLLAEKERLDEETALALMIDVARGLAVAHDKGIVHRDVKPDNVLVTAAGIRKIESPAAAADDEPQPLTKLADFGLARSMEQSESLAITRQGTVMGTPYYMSPEQCRGEATDARSDVYSMGATLFHLLAGRPPFVADTHIGVLNKHAHDPIPSLAKHLPGIGSGIERVVEKSLSKNPDARYADASELLVDLEKLLLGQPTSLAIHPRLPERVPGKALEFEFTWPLTASAAQLWPFVANTDRLNQAMGLPAARFTTRVDPVHGVRRFAETRIAGQRIAWEEHPFEWIEGRRMSVLRQFSSGPFAWFVNVVELSPQADGRTLLSHKIMLEPRNLLGRIIAGIEIGLKSKRSLTRIYEQIDGFIAGGKQRDPTADAFRRPAALNARRRQALEQRLQLLRDLDIDADVIDTLGQFLQYASDQEVVRIRPRAFAERFDFDADSVLKAFLYAARDGLLVLLWDILCPSCRIPANVEESLAALESHGHCEACNADFDLDFANSIEMIFRAHPEIRDAEVQTYCIGGPAFSAHVVAQTRLAPGERFEMDLSLAEGAYRLRGPQLPFAVELRVTPGGATGRCELRLSKPPRRDLLPALRTGSQVVTLLNDSPAELLVRLERTASIRDAVTAAHASAIPLFRELLPGEVLSPGQMVSVATVTLLFAQLDRAAGLYQELGDGRAFEVIRQALVAIEDCIVKGGGAVVKIVGEGIIATFTNPLSATEAGVALHVAVSQLSAEHPLAVRAAVHRGPAMVTTLNDRLDYFGKTVEVTRQMLELAAGGELLVSDVISENGDVAEVLFEASQSAAVVSESPLDVLVQRYVLAAPN